MEMKIIKQQNVIVIIVKQNIVYLDLNLSKMNLMLSLIGMNMKKRLDNKKFIAHFVRRQQYFNRQIILQLYYNATNVIGYINWI